MKGSSGDKARLKHILDAIAEIESYIENDSFDSFASDSMKKYATVKQIEIIGESSNHISSAIKESYPKVSWKEIIGIRNILIHEYFGVDERIVWEVAQNDLPKLKEQIHEILKHHF
ncbi:HepT-like ribonuclease domain-containing protein [Gracilimonas mengyeensis]|uniref:Uncharacterized conserved protein, contains HEPN domain n=1 Tax=Gracilimonas mengyeensis TaxID=1302730 RepID=A0A521F3X7_9BACT|nr:DUF86 domain-containing protein [Gracilimonas mengyeensis]SMO90839.1 Uncharacterized conserved protein, contains HEPN domain [Gracilimonas mengyeensis]